MSLTSSGFRSPRPAPAAGNLAFLTDGEVADLMRAHDWSISPLDHPETWPQSLRSVVGLLLGSKFPMFVAWGPELGFLYNDSYAEVLGAKHPAALGARFQDIWAEIWPDISPLIDAAMAGEASYRENLPLLMHRKGFDEQTWFTFSYSPLRDESGRVAGMFCACTETTGQVLAERRQSFRLELEERLLALHEPRAVMDAAVEALGRYLGAARVGYSEVQDGDETIECHSCFADGVAPILGTFRLADFGPDSIARQRRGQTEIAEDIQADPAQVQDTWAAIETRAYVSVPLIREGRFTASLYVNFRHPRRWTSGEVALIEEVAARTRDAVERARAETSLRKSEARFRLMADAVPQIVWITDAEGRVDFFNRQWADYTGATYQPDTAAAVAASFVHPNDGAATMAAFNAARATGSTFQVEHRIRSAAGDYRWFLVRGEPYRDPVTGGIVRWFGASVDIHDRKLAESALRESEAQLRLATEAAEVGFWDVDRQRDELVWPPRVKAMFGISADRPVSLRDFYAGLHPEDREATTEAFAAAMDPQRRALYDVEYRTVGKEDGRVRWIAAKGRGLFDEEGRCFRVIGTAIDVTARKVIEERLRDLNETLETQVAERTAERDRMWEASPDLMLVISFDGVLRRVNPAWTTILGYRAGELVGHHVNEFVVPEDHDETVAAYELAAQGGLPRSVNRYRHKDGSLRWISWTAAPAGDVIYATGRNITAEKERQAELEAAQEQLRQSQKMEAMGQLTGGVAHDFNNLLTPIVASLDMLLRRGVGSERERRLMDGALQSAERAKMLVQRLLAFARRQPLQTVAVDVADLVQGMADLVSSTTGPQIRVAVEVESDLPPAKADPNQLEMALLNLAVNARDAMPEGGTVRITAVAEEVEKPAAGRLKLTPGPYIRLSVADTGMGMDEETLARAVEPFFSTKGVGKGTGLGLSMVHGLASQLGGTLAIHSRPGLGTNIELWLPQSPERPEATATAPDQEATSGRGTVLLVDDEDVVRLSTGELLDDLGYRVLEAASAEEALGVVQGDTPLDLIVTDHLMPGMTGSDLARRVRALRPGVPILIISGYAESEGIEPDLPRLTKPFRRDELVASLATLGDGAFPS